MRIIEYLRCLIFVCRIATSISSVIDPQLYSRQMLVYGQHAQEKISRSHVAIFGHGHILNEVAKNIALTGVEKITVVGDSNPEFLERIQSYNKHVDVEYRNDFADVCGTCDVAVCLGEDFVELVRIDGQCRRTGTRLVGASVRGVCGVVVSDFGPKVEVEQALPPQESEVRLSSVVKDRDRDNSLLLSVWGGERHGCGLGDVVEVTDEAGALATARVSEVHSTATVRVEVVAAASLTHRESDAGGGAGDKRKLFLKKILPRVSVMHHRPLAELMSSPKFCAFNGCADPCVDLQASAEILASLLSAESSSRDSPRPDPSQWKKDVTSKLSEMRQTVPGLSERNSCDLHLQKIRRSFVRGETGEWVQCPATATVIGGIAAQEVVKAITGDSKPIDQIMVFEALDALSGDSGEEVTGKDVDRLYGPALSKQLRGLRVLLAGVGAIGSEMLKTFALLRVGESSAEGTQDGRVTVVDPDAIEKSNLNRQLLYRQTDIGKSKAYTAASAVRSLLHSDMNVSPFACALDRSTEDVFTPELWGNLDLVMMGLDNVEARQYVDSCCVEHCKPVVDSGTSGLRGHVQTVIPRETESYGSSVDLPDPSVPVCSIKSFPTKPEHCVAWSKALFDKMFFEDVSALRESLRKLGDIASNLEPGLYSESVIAEIIVEELIREGLSDELWRSLGSWKSSGARGDREEGGRLGIKDVEDPSLLWAMEIFEDLYYTELKALTDRYPIDAESSDEGDRERFWDDVSRKFPSAIERFDLSNPEHKLFAALAARLSRQCLGEAADILRTVRGSNGAKETSSDLLTKAITALLDAANSPSERGSLTVEQATNYLFRIADQLRPIVFDKDLLDESHVDFCTVASNLRCKAFGIRTISRSAVHQLTGNIVPAVVSSTAVVAGLASLEMVKVARSIMRNDLGAPNWGYRNYYVDLKASGSPLSFTDPVPATTFPFPRGNPRKALQRLAVVGHLPESFSFWDKLTLKDSVDAIDVSELIAFLEDLSGAQVTSLSYGDILLFADFLPSHNSRLSKTIREVMEDVDDGASSVLWKNKKYLELVAGCEDSEGKEVPLPALRIPILGVVNARRSIWNIFRQIGKW